MAITYHAGRRIQALESDGTSSTTQGYDGGNGLSIGTTYGGGGGGGAGGAGTDCTSSTTGNGGIGFINNISGSTTGESSGGNYYLGGGGFGGTYAGNFGVDGLGAAFGGGGNGGYRQSGGGNGTTGVVILKLLTSASFSTSGSPASTTSGSHTILTYTGATGSLIINSGTVDVQYLVLAGGGGAGGNNGFGGGNGSDGGGAGGILTGTLSLTADTYSVTVGTGGAGGSNSGTVGTNGVNSTFSTLTALGGGGGAPNSGNTYLQAATGGGSGGGGAGFTLAQNGTGGLAYVIVTDIRPTNVQVGSRFEETDTRKMYNYIDPDVTNQNIEWQSSSKNNVTISGNTLTATAGSWSCIARSVQTISPSRGGGTVIGKHSKNYGMFGFSKDPYWTSGNTFANGDYMIYHDEVYELGSGKSGSSFTGADNNTLYKVTMDSDGLVKYFADTGSGYTEVYESTVTASGEYYVLGIPDGSGKTVSDITITGTILNEWKEVGT